LTFGGPCIVIYSYNKSQRDALSLNFILVKNSTCFGQTYCPSPGVLILYSQQLVFVILLAVFLYILLYNIAALVLHSFSLVFSYWHVCFASWALTNLTNTNCCEYSIQAPDDGQYVCPKHVEFFIKIKLRNSASCWVLLSEYKNASHFTSCYLWFYS
jgi:hypothetical protein